MSDQETDLDLTQEMMTFSLPVSGTATVDLVISGAMDEADVHTLFEYLAVVRKVLVKATKEATQ